MCMYIYKDTDREVAKDNAIRQPMDSDSNGYIIFLQTERRRKGYIFFLQKESDIQT